MLFDVIVVGAGPSGSTAARALGQAGISTLLLDRSSFPRDKPCGGGISARVMERFPYLENALASIPNKWVSKVYFEAPAGAAITYESVDRLYLMIRRCEFDSLLLSLAKPFVQSQIPAVVRHVQVLPNWVEVTARVNDEERQFRGRMVLGCDGVNGVVARSTGLRAQNSPSEQAIDIMEESPTEDLGVIHDDRLYIYYNLERQFGYGYIFPKANHLNVGIGFKMDYYLSELRGKQYSSHRAFVDKLAAQGMITGRSNRANFHAYPLPISGPLHRTSSDRVLVSGDAGGFVNALTGEGIYYAMVSGQHAAQTAIQAVRSSRFAARDLGGYERGWKREIGLELTKSVVLQKRLIANPGSIDRLVRAANRNPQLGEALARYMTGAISHNQLRRFLILRALPLYLAEKLRIPAGRYRTAESNWVRTAQ
jgi:geranylgeranyl reductase family protein